MKKILILTLMMMSFLYSDTYTFLVEKYEKEIELEAKIISNIASHLIKKKLKVYIPNISNSEKNIYSKYITLSKRCEDANFLYIKTVDDSDKVCKNKNSIYFTNNYKTLLNNNKFLGAFFWNKSRPNIVFFKSRVESLNIFFPKEYAHFLEDK